MKIKRLKISSYPRKHPSPGFEWKALAVFGQRTLRGMKEGILKHKSVIFILTAFLISAGTLFAQLPAYEADTYKSPVSFRIENDIYPVHGTFEHFEGLLSESLDEPDTWIALAEMKAPKFSGMTFVSTKVISISPNHIKVHGTLTFLGREESVVVDLSLWRKGKEGGDESVVRFTATTVIDLERNFPVHIVIEGKGMVLD